MCGTKDGCAKGDHGRVHLPVDCRARTTLMGDARHIRRAIELSLEMIRSGRGGPFGAVIVEDGKIIAEGFNQVTSTNDPTAHAEIVAVLRARLWPHSI